jgi:uncharacterized protein (TIGR04255 family)
MENLDLKLPEFRNPPVVEKILGVQFAPIEGWTSGHAGWFWKTTLDETWAQVQDAPPVPDQFERFDDHSMWSLPEPKISFSKNVQSRLMIINNTDDRLIQLQETRFMYNWKRQASTQLPFSDIYIEFEAKLQAFQQFLLRAGLTPTPHNQWEVTYVNHVPRGSLWDTPSDWGDVFPGLIGRSANPATKIKLESISGAYRFVIPPGLGRIHAQYQHGKMPGDGEVLVLNLTARGPLLPGGSGGSQSECMKIGHDALVRSFVELSSNAALDHWGKS